jgi:hypothetical protein
MNTGNVSFPPHVVAMDTAPIPGAVNRSASDAHSASGRKLRNRLILINTAVWVAVIVACRMIFF